MQLSGSTTIRGDNNKSVTIYHSTTTGILEVQCDDEKVLKIPVEFGEDAFTALINHMTHAVAALFPGVEETSEAWTDEEED